MINPQPQGNISLTTRLIALMQADSLLNRGRLIAC